MYKRQEYLQGIRVGKAYNLLGAHFDRLRDAFAELRRACIRQEAQLGPFVLLSIALVRAGLTLMVLCGTYLLLSGDLSLPIFILFLVVGSRVFDPLTSALTNFAEFRYFSIAGGRILTLMDEPEMRGELQSPVTGDICFEHVSFAYRDKEVLHDVSITLSKNSLTALVGPSGSGKSTVMKLCARFYDPQKGRVFFGDLPIDKINPESLMSHISVSYTHLDVYKRQPLSDTCYAGDRYRELVALRGQYVFNVYTALPHIRIYFWPGTGAAHYFFRHFCPRDLYFRQGAGTASE